MTTKIRKLFYKFYQLRDILNIKLLKLVYNALVESILRYCIIIWGGSYNNAIHNLEVSQHIIIKIIFKKENKYSTDLLYNETGLLNIRSLFIHSCLIYLTKIDCLLVAHEYTTRSIANITLQVPLQHKSHTQRFITYFAPKFFNILPLNIKLLQRNIKKFKIKTRNFISANYKLFERILNC